MIKDALGHVWVRVTARCLRFKWRLQVAIRRRLQRTSIRHGWGSFPVLIYQVGKVGSSSVYSSLKRRRIACVHVHRIDPENIGKLAAERMRSGLPVKDERLGLAIHHRLRHGAEKVRIITMVREPLSRNISAFFENLTDFYGGSPLDSISVDEAVRRFLGEYPHHVPLEWFDLEFARVTGISVFDHPFPHEQQWSVIKEGRFEILVIRVEAPDPVKKAALEQFLGIDNLEMVRANEGGGKNYATLYDDFRKRIRIPASYVDEMLDSRYARHFYSGAELSKVREAWQGKVER
jgi:hypothetical protein